MDRDGAVRRISDGLGFRAPGHPLEPTIALRLQEGQRDLEKGKTLPKFLLQENQELVLPAGQRTVALPTGFLREWDEMPLGYRNGSDGRVRFLERKIWRDAVEAASHRMGSADAPSVYVILRDTIDFVVTASKEYRFVWSWFKAGQLLTSNIENEWLAPGGAPEWLIGEAGYRIAFDLRDQEGKTLFDDMRTRGRASVLGDQFILEESGGMFEMGGGL